MFASPLGRAGKRPAWRQPQMKPPTSNPTGGVAGERRGSPATGETVGRTWRDGWRRGRDLKPSWRTLARRFLGAFCVKETRRIKQGTVVTDQLISRAPSLFTEVQSAVQYHVSYRCAGQWLGFRGSHSICSGCSLLAVVLVSGSTSLQLGLHLMVCTSCPPASAFLLPSPFSPPGSASLKGPSSPSSLPSSRRDTCW